MKFFRKSIFTSKTHVLGLGHFFEGYFEQTVIFLEKQCFTKKWILAKWKVSMGMCQIFETDRSTHTRRCN